MPDDLLSPADPRLIGVVGGQARVPFSAGKGVPTTTGIAEIDQGVRDWQQRNFGRTLDTSDRELANALGRVSAGRPLFPPLMSRVAEPLDPYSRPPQLERPLDVGMAINHGFEGSLLGALKRWVGMDGALKLKADPDYDIFADRQIVDSPFKDKWRLFESSGSAEETAQRIRYYRRHEQEGARLEQMTGGAVFDFAGAMLGDPLNFVPATLGAKVLGLTSRSAMLASPTSVALGARPVIWGGIKDGLRAMTAQSMIALADAGLHEQLDPSQAGSSLADTVALPGAIAAGVGFLAGAKGRYDFGVDAWKRAHGDAAFRSSTRASPRNLPVGEGPAASGALTEAEVRYWEKAAAANPYGRFHVDGQVEGIDGDSILFRTAEGLETRIASRDVDVVSKTGERGIVVSSDTLTRSPTLMGSAMKLDGEFLGGGKPGPWPHTEAMTRPGSLATDYAAMREVEIAHGSLSAFNAGGATSRAAQLAANKMVPTGIGLEKLPFDVLNRAAMLPFTTWQTTVEDMLSYGGRQRMGNTAAFGHLGNVIPVETLIKQRWFRPTAEVLREFRDQWQAARSQGVIAAGDAGRIGFELKTTLTDKLGMTQGISFEAFRRRIGDALINGDRDFVTDAYSPQIEAGATKMRGLLDRIRDEASGAGLFREAHEEQLAKAEAVVAGLKKAGNSNPDALRAAELRVQIVQDLLHDVINGGPRVNTAKSFRPRIWLVDQLRERGADFKQIVDDWLRTTQPALSPAERATIATEIHETLMRDKPAWEKKDVARNFNDLADPGSAKGRTFQIPDLLVKDFLENDAEAIMRSHSRVMGTGIEMHRRFGSTGMEDQIRELDDERKLLFAAAPDNAAKKEIQKQHATALADLEATRDRLYGVYGVPDDPHRWQSRTIRMAKQFTNLTVLGMSGISAMGDLARPLMTEGLQAVHDYGFRTLASDMRGTIFDMARKDLEFASDGMELINNTRALSASDGGDMFRSRSPFERGLAKANSWFFVANGLNFVNQIDKEWAGVIIQGRMNEALLRWAATGTMETWQRTRLAAAGIDEPAMARIAAELKAHGGVFGKLKLAQLDKWTDEHAASTYAAALSSMVNRTVPTPGLGDIPNWMSKELGTLTMQYKAFSIGALNRSLYTGLQEEGGKFWFGAAAMVGFAMILNEMRSRLFYDRSTADKPLTAMIMDGVDRSSILGWFADANKAVEVLSGHRAGIRPLVGAERPREESGSRVIGTVAGPAAGQATNALQVLGDFLALHPTRKTFADARQLIPGQNLPYLDPAFDALVSDGKRYPERKKKRAD